MAYMGYNANSATGLGLPGLALAICQCPVAQLQGKQQIRILLSVTPAEQSRPYVNGCCIFEPPRLPAFPLSLRDIAHRLGRVLASQTLRSVETERLQSKHKYIIFE